MFYVNYRDEPTSGLRTAIYIGESRDKRAVFIKTSAGKKHRLARFQVESIYDSVTGKPKED